MVDSLCFRAEDEFISSGRRSELLLNLWYLNNLWGSLTAEILRSDMQLLICGLLFGSVDL